MTKKPKMKTFKVISRTAYKAAKIFIVSVAVITVMLALIFTLFFGGDSLVGETYDRTGDMFNPSGNGVKTIDPITNSETPERLLFERSETDAEKSDKLDEVHNKNLKEAEERSMK